MSAALTFWRVLARFSDRSASAALAPGRSDDDTQHQGIEKRCADPAGGLERERGVAVIVHRSVPKCDAVPHAARRLLFWVANAR